jgi:hypothetical protein
MSLITLDLLTLQKCVFRLTAYNLKPLHAFRAKTPGGYPLAAGRMCLPFWRNMLSAGKPQVAGWRAALPDSASRLRRTNQQFAGRSESRRMK